MQILFDESKEQRMLGYYALTKKGRMKFNNSSATGWFMNDFHRSNSMAAQREVQRMSLQPYSREQKLMQIASLRQSTVSKESSNAQRNRLKE